MPLFIALSGCLWHATIQDKGLPSLQKLIQDKWRRLLRPMLLTAFLFSIPLKYISGYWESHGIDLFTDIICGQILMIGSYNSHLWFLQTLFWIFLISWCLERLKVNKHKVLFAIALVTINYFSLKCHYNVLNIKTAFYYLMWFWCGYIFDHYRVKNNQFIESLPGYVIALSVLLYFLIYKLGSDLDLYVVKVLLAISGMSIVYCISYKLSLRNISQSKLISYLTAASLGLYLYSDPINYPLIAFIRDYGYGEVLYSNFGAVALFLIRFFLTFGIAYLIEITIVKLNKYGKSKI